MKELKKSLISLIVPVHNSMSTLKKCIDTLVNQTYENIEIFLVNNGSQDDSFELCQKLANTDKRIVVLNLEEGNVSKARNAALEVMHGEYFAFVDSDDFIDLTMYEKLYNKATENNADMVFCRYNEVRSEKITKCIENRLPDVVFNKQFNFFFMNGEDYVKGIIWRTLYKSTKFYDIRFKEDIYYGEDFEYLSNLLRISDSMDLVDEYLYYYTVSSLFSSKKYFSNRIIENDKIYAKSCYALLVQYGFDDYARAVIYSSWIHIMHSFLAYSEEYKIGLAKIKKDKYWKDVKSRENYKKYLKILCVNMKFKVRAFLLQYGMYRIYRFLIRKIIG